MSAHPKNQVTPKVTVQPSASEDLNNAGHLAHEMRSQLRDVQSSKPDIKIHQSKGDKK